MNTSKEIWKDIKGYEGIYQASNTGRIKSLGRITVFERNGKIETRKHKERILKQSGYSIGYNVVCLTKDGKQKTHAVHRLIAETFVEGQEDGLEVNHIDGNKHNNRADNLEWVTPSENRQHAYDEGLSTVKRGVKNKLILKELERLPDAKPVEIAQKLNVGIEYVYKMKKKNYEQIKWKRLH